MIHIFEKLISNLKKKSWLIFTFLLSLIIMVPFCFLLDFSVYNLWDSASHFCNQKRILNGEGVFVNSWWLSDLLGSGWLFLAPWSRYEYLWFYLGGAVIRSFSATIWALCMKNSFNTDRENKIYLALIAICAPILGFYLYIGYATVPVLMAGLYTMSAIELLKRKKIYFCLFLGATNILLGESRFNMYGMMLLTMPLIITVFWGDKKLCLKSIFVWFVSLAVTYIITKYLYNSTAFPMENNIMETGYTVQRLKSAIIEFLDFLRRKILLQGLKSSLLMFFLLLSLRYLQDKFHVGRIYWTIPILTTACLYFINHKFTSEYIVWNYAFLIVLPMLWLPFYVIIFFIITKSKQWCELAKDEKKNLLIIWLFVTAFVLIMVFGSNIITRVVSMTMISVLTFFVAFICWWLQEQKYRSLRFSIFTSLALVSLFAFWNSTIGNNKVDNIYMISAGNCKGMCTVDKSMGIEYDEAVKVLENYIKKNEYVLESIPNGQSRFLPASVAAGGVMCQTYWRKNTSASIKKPNHVVIWKVNSSLFSKHSEEKQYHIEKTSRRFKQMINDSEFLHVLDEDNFDLFSRKGSNE